MERFVLITHNLRMNRGMYFTSKQLDLKFKKKIVRLHLEEELTIEKLLQNSVYLMLVFQTWLASTAKNTNQMKKQMPNEIT